eukprot:330969-Chlamydomonas_euryale.AAC.4
MTGAWTAPRCHPAAGRGDFRAVYCESPLRNSSPPPPGLPLPCPQPSFCPFNLSIVSSPCSPPHHQLVHRLITV